MTPIPVKGTVRVAGLESSVIFTFPALAPEALGANVTLIAQVAPRASGEAERQVLF